MKVEETKQFIEEHCKGWQTLAKNIALVLHSTLFENEDCLFMIDGKEGAGKSVLALQIGDFCVKLAKAWGVECEFGIDNIHFNTKDYMEFSLQQRDLNKRCVVNILDEARADLFKGTTMSKTNRGFTNYLSQIRDANQIHIIVLPAFHDIDKYIFMWRQRLIVHIDKTYKENKDSPTGWSLDRGKFKVFEKNMHLINCYFSQKIRYQYPAKCYAQGRFYENYPISKAEYQNKKQQKRKETFVDTEPKKEE